MLKEDKDKLKELVMNYPVKDLMKALSEVTSEVVDDMSDLHEGHAPPIVKEYAQFAATLEDLAEGRPFLL